MSDILTRLLLKTDDFNRNLSKSKSNVNGFQSSVSGMAKTAGAGVLKFAGGLGVAVTAGEAFMKTIRSSQATSDAFDNNINAAKDSVDAFFISISTGDFSNFENGLFSVFTKAKELSAVLDDLADKRLSVDLVNLKKQGQMTELEAIIRDSSKTKEEREKALEAYKELAQEVSVSRLDLAKEEFKGNTDVELNKLNIKNLTQDDVSLYLEKLNNKDLNADFLKQLEAVTNYKKQRDDARSSIAAYYRRNGADAEYNKRSREFDQQWLPVDDWMSQNFQNSDFRDSKQLIDFGKLFQQNDQGRAVLYSYASKLEQANISNAAENRKLTRLGNSLNGSSEKGGKGSKTENYLDGSLGWFDTEIKKQNDILIKSTTDQARNAARATIEELNNQKDKLVFIDKHSSVSDDMLTKQKEYKELIAWFDDVIAKKTEDLSKATNSDVKRKLEEQIKFLESRKTTLQVSIELVDFKKGKGSEMAINSGTLSNAMKGTTLPDKLEPIKPPVTPETIDLVDQYSESLRNVSGIMGSMSGLFDENTASVLRWGESLFSTVSQALPMLQALEAKKQTNIVTTQAETNAEVANAGAKTLSAHSGIPFVGIGLGLAGVAAIIGAMSSIPKFEHGGIVPGLSYSGDNVLARVNSGEMILNGAQQSKLFNMIDRGDSGGNQIGGEVVFRIKGKELEGVLANYNHQKKKVK